MGSTFEQQNRPRRAHGPRVRAFGNSAQVDRNRTGAKIRFHVPSCQTGMGDFNSRLDQAIKAGICGKKWAISLIADSTESEAWTALY